MKEINKEQMDELKERSGTITSADPLVSFLYELMRDHLPCGVIEHIVQERDVGPLENRIIEYIFTNGYLVNYAMDVAKRLRRNDK